MTLDVLVRVAKALAAADRNVPGRDNEVWATLAIDEQTRYTVMARIGIETYVEAIADPDPDD